MIIKKHILDSLQYFDECYNDSLTSESPNNSIYYSKLALLEYCGWIEESMDLIIKRSVKSKITTQYFRDAILERQIIRKNHGFHYENNFLTMLIKSVGLQKAEKVHLFLDTNNHLQILKSELESVKERRDDAAHTRTTGATNTYDTPSVTIARLQKTYPILKVIYSEICKL